jgi:hypothetical protein
MSKVGQTAVSECRHHWVLGEPRDGLIDAVCKNCNARRFYTDRLELVERFDDYRELTAASEPIQEWRYQRLIDES